MKRFGIKHTAILVGIALIIFVILQLYHAFQLYDRKSEELSTHIDNVLSKVAIRHEKASDLQRYTSFFGEDFSGQYKQALKQEFQNLVPVQESVSIRDTTIHENGRNVKYLYITGNSFDSITHVSAKHSVMARDISEVSSFISGGRNNPISPVDSNDLAFQLDKRVLKSLFKKSKYINELMISAFRSSNELAPQDRINLAFLDSIISKTFEVEGLETKFKYAITDEEKEIIPFPSYTDRYDLEIDTLEAKQVVLFPGNVFDEKLTLFVSFPKKGRFLMREMWTTITISGMLILLIFFSFYVLFRIVLTQRRLAAVKNDFISNMTHEFKTPISTISLACEAMSDSDMNKNDYQTIAPFVKMIDEENNRLEGLVEQILKSAALDRGDMKLKRESLELNGILSAAVAKAQIRVGDGKVVFKAAPGKLPFIGDTVHINNIFSNLIDNAIKYSQEKIYILVKSEQLKNGDLRVTIEDNGIGIKNEHLDKIFDKLYRVPTGNVHNVKGYGLGLNYVKQIVDLHKWSIQVKSKFGIGTTFIITIKTNSDG